MIPRRCSSCAAPTGAGDRFCESCGQRLLPTSQWLSSTTRGGTCAFCTSGDIDRDGYCGECGRRRSPGRDRVELDLGSIAAVTDRGPHRRRNEDAAGIGRAGSAIAGIVCDGIASTVRADEAAHAAVNAGIVALARDLSDGASPAVAARASFRHALAAVTVVGERLGTETPPSCTYASAIAKDGTIVVCWVGDSRIYWLPARDEDGGPVCLTVDDSLAGQLAAAGLRVAADLGADGAALIRWLGADADNVEPHLGSLHPAGPGRLVLCSDGLSRYLAGPADLVGGRAEQPGAAARRLAQTALDAGGHDNITVIVIDVQSRAGPDGSHHPTIPEGGSRP
ncbi:MAG: serine/threonine protein phosphatase [Dactylosporangium sp.]|nr:protein phosphatase 2C domain-containing protein [Dactylosporangium sp.]NNJ61130.1 serine/threonine protein phosphatase [Dactylosporangium sp.]